MSKDKKPDMGFAISERAREYRVRQYNERIVRAKSYFDSIDIELAFKSGATMFSTENAQLREALRGIIKECEEWIIPSSENSNNCENNHHVDIDDLKSLIDKAKQLLTDNTK